MYKLFFAVKNILEMLDISKACTFISKYINTLAIFFFYRVNKKMFN